MKKEGLYHWVCFLVTEPEQPGVCHKCVVATSHDEDFGINLLETIACGKAVIDPDEVDYKETINTGRSGILRDDINENKIIEAMRIIGKSPDKYRRACINQAEKFDPGIFLSRRY